MTALQRLVEAVKIVVDDYRNYKIHPAPNMVRLVETLADYEAEPDHLTAAGITHPEKLGELFEAIDVFKEMYDFPLEVKAMADACREPVAKDGGE